MNDWVIYHNPRCSKSRQALAILRDHGIAPRVIEYLREPPTVARLRALQKLLGLAARDLLRTTEDEYRRLHLNAPDRTATELLTAIANHPILLQRPIIVHGKRAVIGRPPENVTALL